MMIKPTQSILIGAGLLIVAVFFVGIYRDPEFPSEVTSFIKYKPTSQFEFADHEEGDNHHPSAEMERQTKRYYDFVKHKPVDFSPLLLQGCLTFFALGIVGCKKGRSAAIGKALLHYISSFLFTAIGLGFLLVCYDTEWRTLIFIIVVTVNLFVAIVLT